MDLGGYRDRNASYGRVEQNWEQGILPVFKGRRGKSPQIEFLSERAVAGNAHTVATRMWA